MKILDEEQSKQLQEAVSNLLEALQKVVETYKKAIQEVAKDLGPVIRQYLDSLETYQKYEMLHPRKKPRGSIRREKKRKRG